VGSRRSALTATLVPTRAQAKIGGTKVHDQAEEIVMHDMRGGIAVPSMYSDSADVIRCESRHCSVPWRKESEETRAKVSSAGKVRKLKRLRGEIDFHSLQGVPRCPTCNGGMFRRYS
jgi:hypothetical protein